MCKRTYMPCPTLLARDPLKSLPQSHFLLFGPNTTYYEFPGFLPRQSQTEDRASGS